MTGDLSGHSFAVDGNRVADPVNPETEPDGLGG